MANAVLSPECEYDELVPISEILEWYGPDENYQEGGDRVKHGLRRKRLDTGYPELLKDMEFYGIRTPVLRSSCDCQGVELGNGYHRIAAAVDLGWTHLPVTEDADVGWSGEEWTEHEDDGTNHSRYEDDYYDDCDCGLCCSEDAYEALL